MHLIIDLFYEIIIRVEFISFMVDEFNKNEEIKKEFLKDFEFYYNHYITLKNFLGKLRKMNIKI